MRRRIYLNIWDDDITDEIIGLVLREPPKSGVTIWTTCIGKVAVAKRDNTKNPCYDIYKNYEFPVR